MLLIRLLHDGSGMNTERKSIIREQENQFSNSSVFAERTPVNLPFLVAWSNEKKKSLKLSNENFTKKLWISLKWTNAQNIVYEQQSKTSSKMEVFEFIAAMSMTQGKSKRIFSQRSFLGIWLVLEIRTTVGWKQQVGIFAKLRIQKPMTFSFSIQFPWRWK